MLSSRRAKLTPEQASPVACGANRRVAGLRREEVATLDAMTGAPGVDRDDRLDILDADFAQATVDEIELPAHHRVVLNVAD